MELRRSYLFTICAITLLALTGCSVRTAPLVTASDGTPPAISEITLLSDTEAALSRNQFLAALQTKLVASDISVKIDAEWVADYSISLIAADSALYDGEAGQSQTEPEPILVVRTKSWTDGCEADRARASLAVYARATGSLAQRGTAEAILCRGDEIPYDDLAAALVTNLTQR